MRRSIQAASQAILDGEDEEEEDWVYSIDTGLKVRASRILGPRKTFLPNAGVHLLPKKRLRKAGDYSPCTPCVPSDSDIKILRDGNEDTNPFDSFKFHAEHGRKAYRGFSLRTHDSKNSPQGAALPLVPSEAAYDGSQSWLDAVVLPFTVDKVLHSVGEDLKRSRRRRLRVAESSDDDEGFEPRVEGLLPNPLIVDTQLAVSIRGKENATRDICVPNIGEGGVIVDLTDHCAESLDNESTRELLPQDELVQAGFDPKAVVDIEEAEDKDELDLIFATLQKCDRVAAALRQDLQSNSVLVDGYAEIVPSTTKIVTQTEVCAACGISPLDSSQVLKPYQLVGVNFLLLLNRKKVGGAILADEMGLGKTVQAVAFLAMLKHLDHDPGPHLIVCPASLLDNWQRELQKWCPSFKVVLFHGNERASLIRKFKDQKKFGNELPFNVMLTCYSMFERRSAQQKDDRNFLRKWMWSCVLMDEAHFLKDRESLRTTRLRDIAQKAKQRVMLTGTPLQNDLQELWSLLEFLLPDIFCTGKDDLSKLLGTRNRTATVLQEDGDLITHMKAILGPFVLRRLKCDVMKQLVPKIHKVEYVSMIRDQAAAYQEAVAEYRAMTAAARGARTETGSLLKDVSFPKRQIQNIFTQLRKVSNHPLLIRRLYSDQDVEFLGRKLHSREVFGNQCTEDRVIEELKGYNDFTLYQLCVQNGLQNTAVGSKLSSDHPLASAKCQILGKLLPELKQQGHRALIFSQWTQMLDILEWACDVMGLRYLRLDGSTQVRERQEIVDSFNNDSKIFVFLLSTRAGGQGLNLTGADTVIIHDVDFNPQMDKQAEDRCHRIGQQKPVTVYRLVTKGSVDESIYNIAQRKLVLDAAVLESGGAMSKENGEFADGDAQTMEEILSAILASVPS